MLGCPLGRANYMEEGMTKIREHVEMTIEECTWLEQSQVALKLLQYVAGAKQLTYHSRTLPLTDTRITCRAADQAVNSALENILKSPLSQVQLAQARLPRRLGN